tara:strand:- start:605 stop:1111 length:507 start_codon:yes stop_codon:yes gene_type:complete
MNKTIYYICQTLVEDGRMEEKIFQYRIINPLKSVLNDFPKLNLCFHPRSDKSIYADLLSNVKVNEDKFSYDYMKKDNIFLGHYSTIIFNLITNSEKVLMMDIDWDPLPEFIYESSSLRIHWRDLNKVIKKLDLDLISLSKPNKEIIDMFANPIVKDLERKKLLDSIFL